MEFWELVILFTVLGVGIVYVKMWEMKHEIKTFKQGWKIIKEWFKRLGE